MGNKPIISIKQYNPEWYPPCFKDREQYKNYMWSIVKVGLPSDGTNYCLDCTREYKIKMLKEKRCEHPETIFVEWRNTDKSAEEMVGSSVIHQNKPEIGRAHV